MDTPARGSWARFRELRLRVEPADRRSPNGVIAAGLLAAALLLHGATAWRYGYFRDELYFIACSKHLAWGNSVLLTFFCIAQKKVTKKTLGKLFLPHFSFALPKRKVSKRKRLTPLILKRIF